MQSLAFAFLVASSQVAAYPSRGYYAWAPAARDDLRSPCPMMNSLANHGYLPRDGRNVSMDILVTALSDAVNLDPTATQLVGRLALTASTTGNASTFNLDDLNTHGVIEHDGSLSRSDIYSGDNHCFNRTIWDSTASHFTEDVISIETAAEARAARITAAAAENPQFNMTAADVQNSFIETSLYLAVFGNVADGNAVTQWVRVLFEQERIPFAEGFQRSTDVITVQDILGLVNQVAAAT